MKIPQEKIDEISTRLGIVDVIGDYVTLTRSGSSYKGLCPFHNEKTPSFTVTPEKNLFFCFGCQKGGTMFNFIMDIEGMSFPDSVRFLAEKAGVILPEQEEYKEDPLVHELKSLNKRVTKTFQYFLNDKPEGKPIREYLQNRGLDRSTINDFELGYAPDDSRWLYRFLRSKNYSPEFLAKCGLFSARNPEICIFWNRVIFPIFDYLGNVIAFGGRAITDNGPKYINSPETIIFKKNKNLYGIHKSLSGIRKSRVVVLSEGYFDVIALHMAGIDNAVAPLGTAFTENQALLLKRWANQAYLYFDGDSAGQKASKKGIYLLTRQNFETFVIFSEETSDPADIYKKEGAEGLKKRIKYSISSFEYLLRTAVRRFNSQSVEGKRQIVQELMPYINLLDSEVHKSALLKELSEEVDIPVNSILADSRIEHKTQINHQAQTDEVLVVDDDLFLLLAVCVNLSYFQQVRSTLNINDFNNRDARDLYIHLEESFRAESLDIETVLNKIENPSLQKLVMMKLSSDEFKRNPEILINDGIRTIKLRAYEKKQHLIQKMLKKAKTNPLHPQDELDLLTEKQYIDKELMRLKGEL